MSAERRLAVALAALSGILTLTIASDAAAQAWLDDRSRTEGPGFRVGDFELHPGLGVEIGYDSNLYYSEDDSSRFRDTGILRATAHLLFSTRGSQRRNEGESGEGGGVQGGAQALPPIVFRGGLSGSFYTFFNDLDRSNMEVDASLALTILPGRTFSLSLTEEFGRSVRPFTENTAGMPVGSFSYARIQNTAGAVASFSTNSEVLKISTGYMLSLDFFEDELFQYGNRLQHIVTLNETFRFLPQTAIVHDTTVSITDYLNDAAPSPTMVNDGVMLRTRVGLNGAFSSSVSALAMVGYAAGFFSSSIPATYDQEYESVIAQAELRWQISQAVRLTLGYDRDFQPSFIGNWYRRDRGYANFQMLVDGQFLVGVEAGLGYYEFGLIVTPTGDALGSRLNRGDIRLDTRLFAEYRFTDWLGLNATLQYTGNFTDYQYRIDDGTGMLIPDPAQFNKFQAWFGVRVFY